MPKGKSGNPAGKPKGTKNRVTLLREAALAKLLAGHKDPLGFMLGIMVSDKADLATRIDCAKAAAPYVHKRQPIAIENSDKGPFQIFDAAKLGGMSETEIKALMVLIQKAGALDDAVPVATPLPEPTTKGKKK